MQILQILKVAHTAPKIHWSLKCYLTTVYMFNVEWRFNSPYMGVLVHISVIAIRILAVLMVLAVVVLRWGLWWGGKFSCWPCSVTKIHNLHHHWKGGQYSCEKFPEWMNHKQWVDVHQHQCNLLKYVNPENWLVACNFLLRGNYSSGHVSHKTTKISTWLDPVAS